MPSSSSLRGLFSLQTCSELIPFRNPNLSNPTCLSLTLLSYSTSSFSVASSSSSLFLLPAVMHRHSFEPSVCGAHGARQTAACSAAGTEESGSGGKEIGAFESWRRQNGDAAAVPGWRQSSRFPFPGPSFFPCDFHLHVYRNAATPKWYLWKTSFHRLFYISEVKPFHSHLIGQNCFTWVSLAAREVGGKRVLAFPSQQ